MHENNSSVALKECKGVDIKYRRMLFYCTNFDVRLIWSATTHVLGWANHISRKIMALARRGKLKTHQPSVRHYHSNSTDSQQRATLAALVPYLTCRCTKMKHLHSSVIIQNWHCATYHSRGCATSKIPPNWLTETFHVERGLQTHNTATLKERLMHFRGPTVNISKRTAQFVIVQIKLPQVRESHERLWDRS